LIRYHGKMMIVDSRILHVYGFNFTAFDMEKSRSFGVITKNAKLVCEAMKLFAADFDRQPYVSSQERLIVSPENSRERLSNFIKGARKELFIYDPKATDDAMLRLIEDRLASGVDVKIIGKVEAKWDKIPSEKFPGKRLHVRAMIRDGRRAFVGSQSLRRIELDKRRELGVIINDQAVVNEMRAVFQSDWARTDAGKKETKRAEKAAEKGSKKEEKQLAAAS
jgi:phosphatidylserine/phosphatidylglycerophosphate/cardiolipin synthase-like enzyme